MPNPYPSGAAANDLRVESAALSDQGRKKRNNEDWVERHEPDNPEELTRAGRLYIVADGVGGAVDGERASQYAAQKVLYDYYQLTELDPGERLRRAIQSANADIYAYTEKSETPQTMGTTLVAAALRGAHLAVANVGDSRAYLIRGTQIQQLTRDHSLVQQLLDDNEITPEQAANFRRKNVILRSVGSDPAVDVDLFQYEVKAGDLLLLCTDGLHKYFPDPAELARVAASGPLEQAARRLIALANERGGSDNISAVLVRIYDARTAPAPAAVTVAPRSGRALDLDDMPTSPGLRQAGQVFIGRRPVSRRWQAILLAAGALLIVLLAALGLAVGTQLFGEDPTPTNAPTPAQALTAPPPALPASETAATAIPPTAAAPTASAAAPVPPSETPAQATAAQTQPPAAPQTNTAPAATAQTFTLENAPICKWKVPAGGSLNDLYKVTWETEDWNGYQTKVSQLNDTVDLNLLQIGQTLRVPWPKAIEAGEPPCPP